METKIKFPTRLEDESSRKDLCLIYRKERKKILCTTYVKLLYFTLSIMEHPPIYLSSSVFPLACHLHEEQGPPGCCPLPCTYSH